MPIAVAMEAAPQAFDVERVSRCDLDSVSPLQGYPYVGLVALTFVSEPTVAFSITPENILGGAVSAVMAATRHGARA